MLDSLTTSTNVDDGRTTAFHCESFLHTFTLYFGHGLNQQSTTRIFRQCGTVLTPTAPGPKPVSRKPTPGLIYTASGLFCSTLISFIIGKHQDFQQIPMTDQYSIWKWSISAFYHTFRVLIIFASQLVWVPPICRLWCRYTKSLVVHGYYVHTFRLMSRLHVKAGVDSQSGNVGADFFSLRSGVSPCVWPLYFLKNIPDEAGLFLYNINSQVALLETSTRLCDSFNLGFLLSSVHNTVRSVGWVFFGGIPAHFKGEQFRDILIMCRRLVISKVGLGNEQVLTN